MVSVIKRCTNVVIMPADNALWRRGDCACLQIASCVIFWVNRPSIKKKSLIIVTLIRSLIRPLNSMNVFVLKVDIVLYPTFHQLHLYSYKIFISLTDTFSSWCFLTLFSFRILTVTMRILLKQNFTASVCFPCHNRCSVWSFNGLVIKYDLTLKDTITRLQILL